MDKKPEVPPTRARVIRTRTLPNGRTVKSVIPIHVRPTPHAERQRRRALALELERVRLLETTK